MPLYKRKPFASADQPDELKPDEVVYKIDFTNEVFRSYDEYLERMNLYGERAWTCKLTGKGKLTYQEALASEGTASEKIRNIPEEYLSPVLREIQFSKLPMKDLLESIYSKFQAPFSAGDEVFIRLDGALHPRKMVEEIKKDSDKSDYKVKRIDGTEVVIGDEQLVKNLPISMQVLKSFIKGSTSQSRPWTLHKDLATRHGISDSEYPIDDLLVQPSEEDRMLAERPNLCRDFGFPMESVGDFLLVWNFCDSFSKVLKLSPFSFEDFRKSVSYIERAPPIVVQACVALLRLLAENNVYLFEAAEDAEITETNWSEYLYRLFDGSAPELSNHAASIKQVGYSQSTVPAKISLLRELVDRALETDALRDEVTKHDDAQGNVLDVSKRGNRKRPHIIADGGIEQGGEGREGDNAVKRLKVGDSKSPSDGERVLSPKEIHKLKKSEIMELLAKKSPEQRKAYVEREMEKCSIRSNPLGRDRTYNRYWFFESEGRIFVENHESTQWGYYQSKNEVDALIGSLNPKGVRERALKQQLQQSYKKICTQLHVRWKEAIAAADPSVKVRRSARNRGAHQSRGRDALPSFLKYENNL